MAGQFRWFQGLPEILDMLRGMDSRDLDRQALLGSTALHPCLPDLSGAMLPGIVVGRASVLEVGFGRTIEKRHTAVTSGEARPASGPSPDPLSIRRSTRRSVISQLTDVLRPEVGQLMVFPIAREILDRMEAGRTGRQALNGERPFGGGAMPFRIIHFQCRHPRAREGDREADSSNNSTKDTPTSTAGGFLKWR